MKHVEEYLNILIWEDTKYLFGLSFYLVLAIPNYQGNLLFSYL